MAEVRISDVVVPQIFAPYMQVLTEQKSRLIQSGVVTRDSALDAFLGGGGLTFNVPSWKDLDGADADLVSNDDPAQSATPSKIGTLQEIAARLNRNKPWSSMDLVSALAGSDPMEAIANRVAYYWTRRLQALFVSTMKGVFADNAAAPSGADTHAQNDLTVDVKGASYSAGVTDFTAEAFLDAAVTLGDSAGDVGIIMVHSLVYTRMQKNNLIDFIPDARGEVNIPTFLGRQVIVDDGMPAAGGVFESWLFGPGVLRMGVGSPRVPVEVDRAPEKGNGGGQETLYTRNEWSLHPAGHAFIADLSATPGGPTNTTIEAAASWRRVFPERKQIKIARLITRES